MATTYLRPDPHWQLTVLPHVQQLAQGGHEAKGLGTGKGKEEREEKRGENGSPQLRHTPRRPCFRSYTLTAKS